MDVSASPNEPQTLESLDISRILELLPHRYPFLMVDRIVDILGDESCIGIKNVTINEPHFAGHFPEQPVMPGVLLVEGMAQTAGAVCILRHASGTPKLVYFMTIDKCKFRRPVVPGDIVHYHVRKIRNRKTIWKYAAEARVDGQLVAEAEVSAMIADK
jgi:3-hydroxyacyl-[acyl-carrier-protein] dehydratase